MTGGLSSSSKDAANKTRVGTRLVQSLGPRRMPTTASADASSHAPGSSQVQNLAFYLQNVSKRTSARSNMNICLQRIRGDADSSDEDLHDLLRAEAVLESSKSHVSHNSSTTGRKYCVSSSFSPSSKRSLLRPQDDSDSTTPARREKTRLPPRFCLRCSHIRRKNV